MGDVLTGATGLSDRQLRLLELLKKQQEREAVTASRSSAIRRRNPAEPPVLSFGQKRLWFIEQLQPGSAAYNVPGAVRIRGRLDTAVLRRCFAEIGRRHEILRTSFHVVDGEPVPVIAPEPHLRLAVTDLRALPAAEHEGEVARVIRAAHEQAFDMTRDPLARTCLLRLGDEEHVFLLVLQHIICDIWSVGVFFRTMMALYDGFLLGRPATIPELPIQYTDYAAWQQRVLQGESLQELLAYWQEQVTGAPFVIDLPIDHPRPAIQSFAGGRRYMTLGVRRTEALKAVGKQQDASLYMVLLAALQTLLYRHTGQTSILVGVPMANRNRLELEGLIGLLFNALVLRADFPDLVSFRQVLAAVRERTLGAFAHQDLPFERLVEDLRVERDMSRNPVFQVLFAFQNVPPSAMAAQGLSLARYEVLEQTSREDLELDLRETADGLAGWIGYDAALFDRTTAQRTALHFESLLDGIISNPDRPVVDLPLLSAAEMQAVVNEWNDTAAAAAGADGWSTLFAAQAVRTPESVAAVCDDRRLTYRELSARANALAWRLRGLGVGPGTVVGLLDGRGLDLLTAIVAVLAAGGAYLPLDPEHPPLRHAQVLSQSGAPLVLASGAHLPTLAMAVADLPAGSRPRLLELADLLAAGVERDAPAFATGPSDLVYAIFTSGSTGLPKGAMIEQRGMLNHLFAKIETLGLHAGDVVAQTASQCFDISVWQLLAALTVGGRVQIYSDTVVHDPAQLLARAAGDGVTILETVPSLLRLMLEEAIRRGDGRPSLTALRWMIATGEALPPAVCRQWLAEYPRIPLLNAYGPTECADDVTHLAIAQPLPPEAPRVPIGHAVRSTALYVVDRDLRPLAIGVAGELCVGGAGVGRGYLNAPERTAGVFVPDPFSDLPGARLYRTGDRVRRIADGCLDFLGRIDHQVKVRGFRIELGEVETVLGQHPVVRQGVVLAQPTAVSDHALVAYVVAAQVEPANAERALRDHLKARLPEYMVPAAFVFLDALPLLASGKVDRKALLAAGGAAFTAREGFVAPRNPVEESLAAIWAQILKVERVGVYDNFFELGGQSLLATQVVSRIRDSFAVELPVRALFQKPDVAGLAEAIETALLRGRGMPEAPPMVRVPRDGHLQPSFGQERFWFIDQFRPGLTAYNIFGAVRMRGSLDPAILARSFAELLRRHEVLRSTFTAVDGKPVQVIQPPRGLRIPLVDLGGLPERDRMSLAKRLDDEEAQQPFDLANGPLIRAQLTRVGADDHLLAVTAHHIVYDVWSRELLIRELGALYAAFWHGRPSPLPELEIQYADFAAWQRRWLQGDVLASQLAYWKRQLAGVTAGTELPGDYPRPPVQSFRGARVMRSLPAAVTAALKELSKKQGVTLFMTLLAGFQAFLYRYTREEDIVVGSPIANRNRAETEGLIGFFVNTQVLRTDISGRPTFRQLIARAREVALGAYAHQDLSFEQLVTELRASRDPARQPLFQILFNFLTNYKPVEMELPPGLRLTPEPNHSGAVQFDLIFSIYEAEGTLHFSADYSTDLYERATMARMVGHYADLLAAGAAGPDHVFSELPLGDADEWRRLLVDWNDTATDVPWGISVQSLFEAAVERAPEGVAALCGERTVTYGDLNRRANALAHRLISLGIGPGRVVALLADRGIDFLAAVLGLFKAGGAYLPLDVRHPAERLRQVVAQSGAELVLVSSAFAAGLSAALTARLGDEGVRLQVLEELLEAATVEGNPPVAAAADDLAYVIYTSGSTGIPKGAMITHRGMLNHLFVKIRDLDLSAGDTVAQTASHTFDISVWQLLAALLVGGRVHVFEDAIAHDPPQLLAAVARHGVTVLETVPSLLRSMLGEAERQGAGPDLSRLRWLVATGEELPPELCRRWLETCPEVPLVNAYGPTECSDDVTHHILRTAPRPDLVHVPIGRPVGNTRLYVVGSDLLPVPQGVAGELVVGGVGVGRGYLHEPARTAEVFIPDPFSDHPGARLYRTQDLVRLAPGDVLEFLGRVDHQVKIRGSRIELGEIEAVLARHPQVDDAVVVVKESGADKRLVAFVVATRELAADPARLRAFLAESLPDYMLPAAFVFLAAMPLTANGKVDRTALAAIDVAEHIPKAEFVAPRNEVEEQLAGMWRDLLGVERVGVQDNFFDLGGHSLLTTQLVSRLRGAFQLEVPLPTFFEDPTVAGLAQAIELARWADYVAREGEATAATEAYEEWEI